MRAYFFVLIVVYVAESLVRNANGLRYSQILRSGQIKTSLRGNFAIAIPDGESPSEKALKIYDPKGETSKQIDSNMKTLPESIGEWSVKTVKGLADILATDVKFVDGRSLPVASALQKMKKDMEFLDDLAARTPQLSTLEIVVLFSTVAISAVAPSVLSVKVVEVLVPSLAALSASIGISAEYIGKIAVANGKEVAALAIQVAAESEALLAAAERTKAILPLCVGIATTASAFALLAPSLIAEINSKFGIPVPRELYLLFPLVSVLAAAIAGLATQESQGLASRAIGVGNRRFASSKSVGRTWLSATEQVEASSRRTSEKWKSFAFGVAPAPVIAAFFPGVVSLKAIVCAALAAAQAAYYLSVAEYAIAEAADAVALKARSAAVTDTYANQGSRAGAILPFTSALAGLCAAASAAVVEILPLVNVEIVQSALAVFFPSGAALFASAAAVSKARCEVRVKMLVLKGVLRFIAYAFLSTTTVVHAHPSLSCRLIILISQLLLL
jgi:hypothetical protein